MVAKITTPRSILRVLNYNEKKVERGIAECIYAGNFLPDLKDLTFYAKLNTFKKRIELNTRATTNLLHISLNFHPSENLHDAKLIEIGNCYMDKIGFKDQPFLVYRHRDTAHPHLHIITTSILEGGKRIDTYNIGKNKSETARKQIEEQFQLIKASGRKFVKEKEIDPAPPQRIKYGTHETKRSIINVLDNVINQYKYTSLVELNTILKLYNVVADRGSEEGRIYKNRGLTYKIINGDNKVGVPIKASSIYFKPTLAFLEKKFKENESLRLPYKQKLKTSIDWTLSKKAMTVAKFIGQLQKEKITVVLRKNDSGMMYGITFIDHRTQCIFNGSDLGKMYSASAIQQRVSHDTTDEKIPAIHLQKKEQVRGEHADKLPQKEAGSPGIINEKNINLFDLLMRNEKNNQRTPYEFLKKKKKRRKTDL